MNTGTEVIKNFMLISAEDEISNAHKYKNIKKFNIYWPKEFKPHLYFSHRFNTKTVIFVLPYFITNCRTKFSVKKQCYLYF